jgi:hypothetical protein
VKYVFLSCHKNAGQNCIINIHNKSFEYVTKFGYSATTVIEQNLIRHKIKS